MHYPVQYVGLLHGSHCWVDAETPSVCTEPLPAPAPAETPLAVVSSEVADAFGLRGMPATLVQVSA